MSKARRSCRRKIRSERRAFFNSGYPVFRQQERPGKSCRSTDVKNLYPLNTFRRRDFIESRKMRKLRRKPTKRLPTQFQLFVSENVFAVERISSKFTPRSSLVWNRLLNFYSAAVLASGLIASKFKSTVISLPTSNPPVGSALP